MRLGAAGLKEFCVGPAAGSALKAAKERLLQENAGSCSKLEWNRVNQPPLLGRGGFYFVGVVLAMFFKRLRSRIKKDIRVIFERDPAARSVIEVVCCYSGLHAIWLHRISHKLYLKGWVLIPRMISNLGRFLTGIEIHPGATIGQTLSSESMIASITKGVLQVSAS